MFEGNIGGVRHLKSETEDQNCADKLNNLKYSAESKLEREL